MDDLDPAAFVSNLRIRFHTEPGDREEIIAQLESALHRISDTDLLAAYRSKMWGPSEQIGAVLFDEIERRRLLF